MIKIQSQETWTALTDLLHVRMPSPPRHLVCLQAYATDTCQPKLKYNRQLWLEQPHPDNYTDETFLQSLKVNGCSSSRSYWQVVNEAAAVTQQMDTVVSVAAVSAYLYKVNLLSRWGTKLALCLALGQMQPQHFVTQHGDLQGWITPRPMLIVVIVPVVFVGGYCLTAGGQGRNKHAKHAVRQVSLLTAGVYFMSPLLQTLTKSVSRSALLRCPATSTYTAEQFVHCGRFAVLWQFTA